LYAAIKGKMTGYKFEKTVMAGLLKLLEDKINKLKESQYDIVLTLFEGATDTEYDEVTDSEVKIVFTVSDAKTKLPFTREPVFIDMAFVVPGTNTALRMETKASSVVNGLVTFRFDATSMPDYEKYSSLEARWGFTSDNWQKSQSRNVSLKYIVPKVVFKNGAPLPSPVNYVNEESQLFKLVNEDNREIAVDYNKLTINNLTNSNIGYTLLKGTNDFSLKLYTNQSTTQNTSLDIYYKAKKIQTISAVVKDSLDLYKASALGKYRVNNYIGNGPNSVLYCEAKADGRSEYTIYNDPSWPDGKKFYASWTIVKHNGRYFYSESGFWHPGYNNINVKHPLKYPVRSFEYHNGTVYTK
jgi:hypothetical protein